MSFEDARRRYGIGFITKPQAFFSQASPSFHLLPYAHVVFTSKESIQTLICDFACGTIVLKKKKKEMSCCICVMITFKWTPLQKHDNSICK